MINLSKDLLQEVIGKEYKILKINKYFIKVIHEEAFNSVEWCEHKVANMCKEWAKSKGLLISSYPTNDDMWCSIIINSREDRISKETTETESIFTICKRIEQTKE